MDYITLYCVEQELRNDAELQEGNLGWLKARMAVLIEICADSDAQRQGSALSKLSTDFKGLLASLTEVSEALTCFYYGTVFSTDVISPLGIYSLLLKHLNLLMAHTDRNILQYSVISCYISDQFQVSMCKYGLYILHH